MEIKFIFFDKENWSIYATINTTIILTLLLLTRQKLDLKTLIAASLMGMMKGDIIPRLIFTGFLSIFLYNKSLQWVGETLILLFSNVITSNIAYNNSIQQIISNSPVFLWIFRFVILGWFIYIFKLMNKENKNSMTKV